MRKFFNFMSESDTRRNELLSERIILNQLSPELRFAVRLDWAKTNVLIDSDMHMCLFSDRC